MITPDYDAVAELLVERGRVREGDQVVISAHDESAPFADALTLACYRRGAVPFTLFGREELAVRALHEIDPPNLARASTVAVAIYQNADVIYFIASQLKNPALMAGVPAPKIRAQMEAKVPIQRAVYDGRRRVVITDFPTRAQAAFYGVPFNEYHDAFWGAITVDYDALARRVDALAAFLAGGREVHITSPKGTDVRLRIDGRVIQTDKGTISLPGEPDADILLNIPTGEACLAPREDGAEGAAVFDFAFVGGARVSDLEVHFTQGRGRLVRAAEGFERARAYFAAGTGDPYVIAELGIGANPALTRPYGSILMDEKIAGTVHLALGNNETLGGTNASSIHQDMIILGPRVTCDGRLVMADGELKI